MGKKSSEERFGSRGIWEQLEAMAREQIQRFVQRLLEEEVTELVGRAKSQRRPVVGDEARPVYRNGHGKPRRLALTCGTIEVRRPAPARFGGAFREQRFAAVQAAHRAGRRVTAAAEVAE